MKTIENCLPVLMNPVSFETYKALTEELVAREQTSGPEQTGERIGFTKLNQQRMKRVEKQFTLLPELQAVFSEMEDRWHWLLLSETWCGDGAQLAPAIAAIANATPAITLTVLLRDENPELMDRHLTNGGRAIPKLICLDAATQEILFTWGPRPAAIQNKVLAYKAQNPACTKEELHEQLAIWYAKDRSKALQDDLLLLIEETVNKTSLAQ